MELVEAKIGNAKEPLFDGMNPDIVYYNAFGDNGNADNKVLPYGEESQDHNEVEVNEA